MGESLLIFLIMVLRFELLFINLDKNFNYDILLKIDFKINNKKWKISRILFLTSILLIKI